jgi:hypothetical protein
VAEAALAAQNIYFKQHWFIAGSVMLSLPRVNAFFSSAGPVLRPAQLVFFPDQAR